MVYEVKAIYRRGDKNSHVRRTYYATGDCKDDAIMKVKDILPRHQVKNNKRYLFEKITAKDVTNRF